MVQTESSYSLCEGLINGEHYNQLLVMNKAITLDTLGSNKNLVIKFPVIQVTLTPLLFYPSPKVQWSKAKTKANYVLMLSRKTYSLVHSV